VASAGLSPDGRIQASGSANGTVIIWDVARQRQIDTLTGHKGLVASVAFSPDGKTLASGDADGTVIIWDVGLESWQHLACIVANRNLSRSEWDLFIGSNHRYRPTCPGLPSR
jgi:WD40 repeat protein